MDMCALRRCFACAGLHGINVTEPMHTPNPDSVSVQISPEVMQHARRVAQDSHTSTMTVVLAAYAAAAAEALERPDVLVNMVTSGREHPALQDVVSCLATLVPVSLPKIGLSTSPGRLLQHTASQLTEAMQHVIPHLLTLEAAGALAKALPFLCLNADLDLTNSCPQFRGLEAARLSLQGIAPLYGSSMLVGYRRICLFLRADPEGGLHGGLAFDPRCLDPLRAQRLSDRFQVSVTDVCRVQYGLLWHARKLQPLT